MPDTAVPSGSAIAAPHPSYVVEVGGQCVSQYGSITEALSAGLALKSQNAAAQVKVYDVREREGA